ncbi:helix-turn-helix domain-containing protein [Halostella litorea]|uniref:helix-turn-helix domain-containing protein n=1 Tax=Halostella litorea TaxID=2528831 RepID=UPI001091DB36|nr:bacterio-opsin activator domain-containing protein [Halostella litorea]
MSREPLDRQTGPVAEVEFSFRDPEYPFVSASDSEECVFELAEMVPRDGGRYAEFFNVTDVEPGRILDLTADRETVDVSLLREYEHGGLFEFLVSGDCPAFALAELGALPRDVYAADGEGRIVAEIPPRHDPCDVVDRFLDESPGAEVVRKQRKEAVTPLLPQSGFTELLAERLTDRQREVLCAAYEAGYYDWPRDCTGEEVAESLGISSATFSEHIHAAERKLLAAVFDGSGAN